MKHRRKKAAEQKDWFFKFEHRTWLSDPNLRRRRRQPALRGIWIDALCHMKDSGGEIRGTVQELANLCDCTPAQMKLALQQLADQEIADVFVDGKALCNAPGARTVTAPVTLSGNAAVTLINRRMKREADKRAKLRARVSKFRTKTRTAGGQSEPVTHQNEGDVTPYRIEEKRIVEKKKSNSESVTPEPPPISTPPPTPRKRGEALGAPSGENPPPEPSLNGSQHPTPQEVDARIYQAYPRHTAKPKALKAIEAAVAKLHKAGHKTPRRHLLHQTQAYAAAVKPLLEAEPSLKRWIPHPTTWFNQGRYDDDPSEWTVSLRRGDDDYTDDAPSKQRIERAIARMGGNQP